MRKFFDQFWNWLLVPRPPHPNRKLSEMEWVIQHKMVTSFYF